jgi:hypothetical protein
MNDDATPSKFEKRRAANDEMLSLARRLERMTTTLATLRTLPAAAMTTEAIAEACRAIDDPAAREHVAAALRNIAGSVRRSGRPAQGSVSNVVPFQRTIWCDLCGRPRNVTEALRWDNIGVRDFGQGSDFISGMHHVQEARLSCGCFTSRLVECTGRDCWACGHPPSAA